MKVKAVIWRPDHTNDICKPKKHEIEGKTFKHQGTTYFLHADRFQVTWDSKLFGLFKKYYTTYYYVQGISQPVPVPNFQMVEEPVLDDDGDRVLDDNGRPVMRQTFPKAVDLGVSGDELAALFNPWFYRTIAPSDPSLKDQFQFYLLVGIACGVGYLIWKIHNLDIPSADEIRAAVAAAHAAAQPGNSITVPSPMQG